MRASRNRSKLRVFPVIFPVNREFAWRRVRSRLLAPPRSPSLSPEIGGLQDRAKNARTLRAFLPTHPPLFRSEPEKIETRALFEALFSVRHFRSTVLFLGSCNALLIRRGYACNWATFSDGHYPAGIVLPLATQPCALMVGGTQRNIA